MKIIVIGATGTIGKGIVSTLKQQGHDVLAASRNSEFKVDITDSNSLKTFFETIGPVDAIVSAAGDAAFAALDQLTDDQIQTCLTSKLMGQINVVRFGTNALKNGGVFVLTGGILAYDPLPKTSMIAMVNAGLEGFTKGAALDLSDGKRIVVVHPPWLAETAAAIGMDATPWPNSETVSQTYVTAINEKKTGVVLFVPGYEPSK